MKDYQEVKVAATIQAPVDKVWNYWTDPIHITKWNQASDDWHSPKAENDLRPGGRFRTRMEAKDGSAGFDFSGTYDEVQLHELISYTLDDGRKVRISFKDKGSETEVTEIFEAETSHSIEMQQQGWQQILNNFKKYAKQ